MTDILEFQIIDIISDDIPDCHNNNNKCFLLTIYGIDNNNDRVVVHVRNYYPYFYLKVPSLPPNNWDTNDADYLIKDICNIKPTDNAPNKIYEDIISQKVDIFKEFYGLQWDIKNNMIQIYL